MHALLNQIDCQSLFDLIQTEPGGRGNLHTRKYHIQKKKKVLKHLNAVKLVGNVLRGFACGPNGLSIEYEIDQTGQVVVTASTLTTAAALDYLDKFIKDDLLKRVSQGHVSFKVKLTKGHYYLRRAHGAKVTKAAKLAVADGDLSQRFVNVAAQWDLRVIRGGGAK